MAFALVPSGGKTCAHCVMLASRGFDYLSESSARAARHAHCDCVVAPSFAEHPVIKGYDPEGLKRAYMLARQSAFVEYGEAREEQIKAQLREMFPHLVSDHHVKASLAQGMMMGRSRWRSGWISVRLWRVNSSRMLRV